MAELFIPAYICSKIDIIKYPDPHSGFKLHLTNDGLKDLEDRIVEALMKEVSK